MNYQSVAFPFDAGQIPILVKILRFLIPQAPFEMENVLLFAYGIIFQTTVYKVSSSEYDLPSQTKKAASLTLAAFQLSSFTSKGPPACAS